METTLMQDEKPRVRVKAIGQQQSIGGPTISGQPNRTTARWLRDTKSGVIASRQVGLRESRDDIRSAWQRAAALAIDVIQNSGRLKGAVDQVLADTVGVELTLNPQPDLSGLGYDAKETSEFVSLLKKSWKRWAWNPLECDLRGKFTVPQMIDIGLRWHIAYGETTGIMSFMPQAERRRYGLTTGTKVCMTPPTRLTQDVNEVEGMFQGVIHDPNGRPIAYRFRERVFGSLATKDYPARDAEGRAVVFHIFDPVDATDVRGISVLASAFRKYIQHEILDDVTLQAAILQTVQAAVLTSPEPSAEAFEAIEVLGSMAGDRKDDVNLKDELLGYLAARYDTARESSISIGGDPTVSHLAPGEKFELLSAQTPGNQYLPFSGSLSRDTARAIGITHGGLTMDHTNSTYSSVRMENSSIWPVVVRRRERIAAPQNQVIYENWLDEEIGEGRIPFKGGYEAFAANRDLVCWAQWQGPAKPTADDQKSAKASSEKLENGTSTLAIECAELGHDSDEVRQQRLEEHQWYVDNGMRSPFDRDSAGAPLIEDKPKPDSAAA